MPKELNRNELFRINGEYVDGKWLDVDGNPIDVSGININNNVDHETLAFNPKTLR